MLWIVTPGAVGAAFPGQNPRIIQGISGARHDRMVAARFEAPESKLESRKRFVVRIEDVDGPITELSEK